VCTRRHRCLPCSCSASTPCPASPRRSSPPPASPCFPDAKPDILAYRACKPRRQALLHAAPLRRARAARLHRRRFPTSSSTSVSLCQARPLGELQTLLLPSPSSLSFCATSDPCSVLVLVSTFKLVGILAVRVAPAVSVLDPRAQRQPLRRLPAVSLQHVPAHARRATPASCSTSPCSMRPLKHQRRQVPSFATRASSSVVSASPRPSIKKQALVSIFPSSLQVFQDSVSSGYLRLW
jgi:hypothetical protein